MKIAVVLCGFPRFAEHVAEWTRQIFADYSVDFYAHFWYTHWSNMGTDQSVAQRAIDSIKPKAAAVDCYENVAWNFIDHVRQKPVEPKSEYYYSWPAVRIFNYNFPGQFIGSSRAVKLINTDYNLVIKTRSDCIIPPGTNAWLKNLVDLVNENDAVYESGATIVDRGMPFVGWDIAFYANTASAQKYFVPMENNLKQLFTDQREFYADWHYARQRVTDKPPGLAHVTWAKLALLSSTVIRSRPVFVPTPSLARRTFDYTWTWTKIEDHQKQNIGQQGFDIFNSVDSFDLITRAGEIRKA
jgi:hypothetical protein